MALTTVMADKGSNVNPEEDKNKDKQTTSEKSTTEGKPTDDPELDELLDSALEDFDKPELKTGGAGSKPEGSNVDTASAASAAEAGPNPPDFGAMFGADPNDPMTEELADEMAKQFEESMKAFMSQDPEMMQQIGKLAEAAGHAGESPQAQQEFAQTLTQTLSGLAENAENLQQEMSEEELAQAFGGMGVGGAGGGAGAGAGGGDMFPMMHGMMRMLLSKDVLYPSLKEIAEKYPKWLEENKDVEEKSALENYQRQHDLISKICIEFEAEGVADTEEIKTQRFEKLMELMQQMQELGQPPKDIVGEMAPGLEFDANGMPKLPGMNNQCVLM